MARLTTQDLWAVAEAGLLCLARRPHLSDFEADTVTAVVERVIAFGREAAISPAEWAVIEDAAAAMTAGGPPSVRAMA